MPNRNGTGNLGLGPKTGRGLGGCTATNAIRIGAGIGLGLGCRRLFGKGFGRGLGRGLILDDTASVNTKEFLQEQKDLMQSRLEAINKQLEEL